MLELGLKVFRFMHEIWTTPTGTMTYTRSQTNTFIMVANMKYKQMKLWLLCSWFCGHRLMFLFLKSAHLLVFLDLSGLSKYIKMSILAFPIVFDSLILLYYSTSCHNWKPWPNEVSMLTRWTIVFIIKPKMINIFSAHSAISL
jgi:hypothetical protein